MTDQKLYNIKTIFKDSFILLILGLGTIQLYLPSIVLNLFFLAIMLIFLIKRYYKYQDIFPIIIILYIESHFNYAVNRGGTFTLLASLFFLYLVIKKQVNIKSSNSVISLLLGVFIIQNILGWIFKNQSNPMDLTFGIISFFGFIFIFLGTSNIRLDKQKVNIFIQTISYLSIYSLFIGFNQFFGIINSSIPFFSTSGRFGAMVVSGIISNSELNAEYSLLTFIVLYIAKVKRLSKPSLILDISILASIISVVLSRSRSALILLIIFIVLYLFYQLLNRQKGIIKNVRLILVFFTLFLVVAPITGFFYNANRFSGMSISELTVSGIVSGDQINRKGRIEEGLNRISEESWWVGYGWGVANSNRLAWWGKRDYQEAADFHSLYLTLPMIFGWLGSISFVLLFIYLILELYLKSKSSSDIITRNLALIFFMILSFFLINEYKITSLRIANYLFMVWVLLGFSFAIVKQKIQLK